MAEPRLTPDPWWLAEFERLCPGDPDNERAALGVAYIKAMWTEEEALEHLDRFMDKQARQVRLDALERRMAEAESLEEVRRIAAEIQDLRAA